MKLYYFCLALAVATLMSGCSNYVANPGFFKKDGPMFVKKTDPEPVVAPVMSISAQNKQAVEALNAMGFETEESEQGVVVYLPPNIYFSSSSSDINLDARAKIAEIASEVNKEYLSEREIEVSGHTDSVGSNEANFATSKLRAEAATGELVFSKVALTRIKTTWFGEEQPRVEEVGADASVIEENRALNRRVEFTILNPGH